MTTNKKHRKTPPSRRKYEEANPVLSFRVPKEVYNTVQARMESEGIGRLEILKAGLGLFEVRDRAEKEIRQKAYDEGYDDGVNAACKCFGVTYPCSGCGEDIMVDTEEEKKAIRQFMVDNGWHHPDCKISR